MKNLKRMLVSIFWPKPRISPQGFLSGGIQLAIGYIILNWIGLREYASIISATLPSPETDLKSALFMASIYILFYFGFYILTPIFLITSGIFYLFERYLFVKKEV